MGNFRDLLVWQKAHHLALRIYKLTASLPPSEQFALRDQIRRAAASIPANIAEGNGRQAGRSFAHFLDVALGSLCETQALLLLALDLGHVDTDDADEVMALSEEVGKMIGALAARCRKQATLR